MCSTVVRVFVFRNDEVKYYAVKGRYCFFPVPCNRQDVSNEVIAKLREPGMVGRHLDEQVALKHHRFGLIMNLLVDTEYVRLDTMAAVVEAMLLGFVVRGEAFFVSDEEVFVDVVADVKG